ncbi:MAG: hypothetical protein AB7D07_02340 [Desulfovibrionaceae bacterium]
MNGTGRDYTTMLTDAMGIGVTNGTIRFIEDKDIFTVLGKALAGKLATPTELAEQDLSDRRTYDAMRRDAINSKPNAVTEQQQAAAQADRAKHSLAMENALGGVVSTKS